MSSTSDDGSSAGRVLFSMCNAFRGAFTGGRTIATIINFGRRRCGCSCMGTGHGRLVSDSLPAVGLTANSVGVSRDVAA